MGRSKAVAGAVRTADPRQIIAWLRDNQGAAVRYGKSQGFVFAFNDGEQWDIGLLAVTGQLTFVRGG